MSSCSDSHFLSYLIRIHPTFTMSAFRRFFQFRYNCISRPVPFHYLCIFKSYSNSEYEAQRRRFSCCCEVNTREPSPMCILFFRGSAHRPCFLLLFIRFTFPARARIRDRSTGSTCHRRCRCACSSGYPPQASPACSPPSRDSSDKTP